MAIIKQISVYDGNSWTLDDIGVNAENVSLSANSSVTLNSILPADKLTTSKALMTNGNGVITTSSVSSSQLGYLSGTTASIQTQLNGKVSKSGDSITGTLTIKNTNINIKSENIAYSTTSPTGVGNAGSAQLNVYDNNSNSLGWIRPYFPNSTTTGIQISGRMPGTSVYNNTLTLLSKSDGTYSVSVTDKAAWRDGLGAPPTSHASTATTYGVGTTANYGHCMTINNLTTSAHANGKALSAYQGKLLYDKIKDSVRAIHVYKPNSTVAANGNAVFDIAVSIPSGFQYVCIADVWNDSSETTSATGNGSVFCFNHWASGSSPTVTIHLQYRNFNNTTAKFTAQAEVLVRRIS